MTGQFSILFFLALSQQCALAWTTKTSFFAAPVQTNVQRSPSFITMDIETPMDVREKSMLKHLRLTVPGSTTVLDVPRPGPTIDEAVAAHGMPWTTSIDPTYKEKRIHKNIDDKSSSLFYMSFWEWQLDFMKKHLTNLRVVPCTNKQGDDMSYVENEKKGMRLHTIQFSSDEYKLIRMTVLDAGPRTQVFTSLWYPDPKYNLPVLGVDLLQFQQNKHLCIVDFQPIQETENDHDQEYEHLLEPIRSQYPSLQGKMTQRFYDEDAFFSKQMLLGRADANNALDVVFQELLPAYQAYVKTHVDLVQSSQPQDARVPEILKRHAAYDNYSSKRDPAHGLLASAFGQEFADDYVYDVLFPLSQKSE